MQITVAQIGKNINSEPKIRKKPDKEIARAHERNRR